MEGRTEPVDQEYIRKHWESHWGLPVVSTRRTYEPEDVHGLVYRDEWGEVQGLITWHIDDDSAEMVTVDAYQQGRHIGGRLLHAAEDELQKRGVRHIMIVTTNDNLRARLLRPPRLPPDENRSRRHGPCPLGEAKRPAHRPRRTAAARHDRAGKRA